VKIGKTAAQVNAAPYSNTTVHARRLKMVQKGIRDKGEKKNLISRSSSYFRLENHRGKEGGGGRFIFQGGKAKKKKLGHRPGSVLPVTIKRKEKRIG